MTGREILLYLALKYNGDWEKMFHAVETKERIDKALASDLLSQNVGQYITIVDPDYPETIHRSVKPPLVLFYKGNLELIRNERKNLSYIGSRNTTPYGERMAKEICGKLVQKGVNIVNGMARGIDAVALRAALDAGGRGIAVLGSGIDNPYPSSSRDIYDRLKENGLILSEYPLKTPPRKEHFPMRNRIVAALSHGLVVGESSKLSGSLITVNFALGYDKEIGCVPFEAGKDSACNALIRDGAHLIETAEDAYGLLTPP